MSKTFTYVLIVIAVYVLIIAEKSTSTKEEKTEKTESKGTNNGDKGSNKTITGIERDKDKNGVSKGASGRMDYQIGTGITK